MSGSWLSGFVVGVAAGALSLEVPLFGGALAVAFVFGSLASRNRAAAVGGTLVGFGGISIAVLGAAEATCRAENAKPGHGCAGPDLTGWLVVAGAFVLIGIGLILVAAIGRRR